MTPEKPNVPNTRFSHMSALIADDEAHMRTFLKLMLMDIGIEKIYLMQNGMDAVEAYKEYAPDVVLMDINMNKMNGIDALGHIREIDPKAKVIMMTAVSARDVVEESRNQGATHYILKTQDPEKIRELIIKTLSVSV
ncbi:response regulator [Pelagicoccus sp. SDUM812003]|uniref:response regulator transcription factor n=1 Tax=Pelagicoccus sp. SDUM812003 TaxID=3041267 RepID=UPI00280DC42D|nr:response regulator [Pelagicoccus sp. SDUM812003]MDQ8202286.1 response regulator [Pelagicoccus sp. SDUM812003]